MDNSSLEEKKNDAGMIGKIKRKFGFRKKIVFEKQRLDGSGEVTIQIPAKHNGMTEKNPDGLFVDEKSDDEAYKVEFHDESPYIEVLTTVTNLFTPHYKYSVNQKEKEEILLLLIKKMRKNKNRPYLSF